MVRALRPHGVLTVVRIASCQRPLYSPNETEEGLTARVESDGRLLLLAPSDTATYAYGCGVDQYLDRSATLGYESYAFHPSAAKIWRCSQMCPIA